MSEITYSKLLQPVMDVVDDLPADVREGIKDALALIENKDTVEYSTSFQDSLVDESRISPDANYFQACRELTAHLPNAIRSIKTAQITHLQALRLEDKVNTAVSDKIEDVLTCDILRHKASEKHSQVLALKRSAFAALKRAFVHYNDAKKLEPKRLFATFDEASKISMIESWLMGFARPQRSRAVVEWPQWLLTTAKPVLKKAWVAFVEHKQFLAEADIDVEELEIQLDEIKIGRKLLNETEMNKEKKNIERRKLNAAEKRIKRKIMVIEKNHLNFEPNMNDDNLLIDERFIIAAIGTPEEFATQVGMPITNANHPLFKKKAHR